MLKRIRFVFVPYNLLRGIVWLNDVHKMRASRPRTISTSIGTLKPSNEGRPVLVTDPPMSWDEAQSYCRANFSDLFAVTNSDVNLQLTDMIHLHSGAWIGLSRDSWKWLNNTSPYSPLPWAAGQPDNSMGRDKCGALDDYGQIDDETCSTLNFFLCQTTRVKQQILRLEVKAGDNVNDRAITADVLNKVQQSLRAQGIAADVKLTWRERPGEGIFQKTESTGINGELLL